MNTDRLELVTRNTEEVVTESELEELLGREEPPTAYTGYEPSGSIHLGHMITVNKLIDLQKAGFDITVLLADVHAYLNEKGTMEEVSEIAEYNKRCFIALGLEESNTRFVFGSDFQFEEEYVINVLRIATSATMNRAVRSMDEVSRNAEVRKVSQVIYPLMQAVDIVHLKVDVAVGGIDQRKIHMLAREELPKIGFRAPVCIHTPIMAGLDGEKMSSSKGNYISMDDTREDVNRKIKNAFCPAGVPEDNPIIELFKYYVFPRFETVVMKRSEKYGGDVEYGSFIELERDFTAKKLHPLDLKKACASYIEEIIEAIRSRMK